MEFFDRAETWSRKEIERVQGVRLRNSVEQAVKSPFYAAQLRDAGVAPEDIRSVADVCRIPLTTKQHLREQYPTGLVAVSATELVRLHASSGTTGAPTVVHHTQTDLNSWADLVARSMYMTGVRPHDVFQNTSGYGLFTGGLGIHNGAERLGCQTIPAGPGNTKRQIKFIRDFNTTVLHIIPSYALYLGAALEDEGLTGDALPCRIALIGAEPHTEAVRRRIEAMLGLKAFNSYGLSEMNGPGVAFECTHQDGMHVWEDAFVAEIIDPKTLEPVAEGEVGELVLTSLCRQGMPVLRYRTRDLTRFVPGPCACGRQHRRIDRILGRADDMMIVKGVNIYPMQIEQILMGFPEVGESYLIELTREDFIDQLCVKVEIRDGYFVEDMRVLTGLQKAIVRELRDEILVTPRVDLVQTGSLPKAEGKAVRVVDKRQAD